jgi:hypothetical protein
MHKTEYEESVQKPMEELVEALATGFPGFAPGAQASARVSLSQGHAIPQKIRTYKTPVAAVFPQSGISSRLNYSRGFSFIVEY